MLSAGRFWIRRHITLSSALAARVTRVPLPALSPTMESGSIVSWDKQEGDRLNEGDLLAEIETDKATMAFETPEEGFLAKILVPAGTKGVPLGQPLCIIVEEEGDIEKYKSFSIEEAIAAAGGGGGSSSSTTPEPQPAATQAPPQPQHHAPPPPSPTPHQQQTFSSPVSQSNDRTFASPLAKKMAREMGLELPGAGSGPNGRVVASDLKGVSSQSGGVTAAPPSNAGDYTDIPLTNMRQTIAKRLTQSKQSIPHYYLTVNLKVDEL